MLHRIRGLWSGGAVTNSGWILLAMAVLGSGSALLALLPGRHLGWGNVLWFLGALPVNGGAPVDASGEEFSNPPWTYSLAGKYEFPFWKGMLSAAMEKSGRSFSDKEVALLTECVSSAKQAVAEGSNFQAALALTRLSPLGPLGNLKSYSELAQEANALTKQVIEAAEKSLAEANTQVGATETSFPGVLTIVEAERAYAAFPTLKATAIKSLKDVEKNQALAEPLRQAQALVRARRLPTVGNPNQYATTVEFLRQFGLTSLADLPPIEELAQASVDRVVAEYPAAVRGPDAVDDDEATA